MAPAQDAGSSASSSAGMTPLRPICVDCAGITTCFRCEHLWDRRVSSGIAAPVCPARSPGASPPLLDDGTGQVAAGPRALFERLVRRRNPLSIMTWLNKAAVRRRLARSPTGSTPLTHEGIDALAGTQGREFLRELLIDSRPAARRDKYLAAFAVWRVRRLASIATPPAGAEIATLPLLAPLDGILTVRAEAGPLPAGREPAPETGPTRRCGSSPSCPGAAARWRTRQNDIDAWFATASNPHGADDFLVFAVTHRRCRKIDIPLNEATLVSGVLGRTPRRARAAPAR